MNPLRIVSISPIPIHIPYVNSVYKLQCVCVYMFFVLCGEDLSFPWRGLLHYPLSYILAALLLPTPPSSQAEGSA